MQRVPTRELELFIVRRFIDGATCAALIDLIDAQRRPSDIVDNSGIANFRTSETCDLDSSDPVVGRVNAKFCDLLGIPPDHALLQGSRSGAEVSFTKLYDTIEDEPILYEGTVDETGNEIHGSWTIVDEWSGSFLMRRAAAVEEDVEAEEEVPA